MGKSKTEYHERPLSPEERQLYAQQVQYMQTIQPGIDALIAKGMSNIKKTYDPDWGKVFDTYSSNIQDILDRQANLLDGNLPSQWQTARQNYYNRLYENTMGQGLQQMAKNGVVGSSRMNTATNDWQKNLSAQMSKDYTNDVNLYNNLLNTRESWLQNGFNTQAQAAEQSRRQATDYFNAARGTQQSNTAALSAIGNNENGRGYLTQSGGGFGNLLGGLVDMGSSFFGRR
ncbi:hypothetical protein MEEL106852_07850 [Megasphaera elsdenii]|uniref:Uncharacterized protein n=1 Tax=Megasphaera elsdenii DSM 20460 TaxID=1064535 RepID=G0VSA6_MEGEL|nr:hypothetical protein [Megasphaera elsdenii]AVO75164.1 hypothetical protein C6362_09565 [Megasphaera elsdenii DSM 20460]CCC74146.1 hypothetical protein MELS_1928 [Megasphaera elsdenii DSM 20460]